MKIYIGTSGYTYNHWVNVFYPSNIKRIKWFQYYQNYFNAVEINATFYRDFSVNTFKKWERNAFSGFKYFLKVPRLITHQKKLVDVNEDIEKFCNTTQILGDKLGGYLFQLHPSIKKDTELLENVINSFNKKTLVIEFRNKQWYCEEVFNLLKSKNVVLCNVQSPEIDLTNIVTSDIAYIRLHGIKNWYTYNYNEDDLKIIVDLIRYYKTKNIKEIYIFFNNDFNGYAPLNALRLKELLVV